MKKLCVFALCLMATSCYYKDGCFYAPQSVNCNIKHKSDFDSYQKIGITDEQKIIDMKNCLGVYGNNIIDYKKIYPVGLDYKFPGKNIAHNFYSCMINKGYIYNDEY
ncbi:hypothetical protein [Neisseria viridiae]|uniref:hypothetical protein n=1 Tax=Neisseria viridiae TaxID=2830648 RepID=UPI0027297125|nr:hypothetical protein [Neisseria viridiae]